MGEWTDKVEGKAKEAAGTVTGDQAEKNKGKAQATWGDIEGKGNDIKNDISNAADEVKSKSNDTYNEDNKS